ncbi:hypothetical protein [Dysosmobacter sp.]|uniref:hypothetical protein n=1 Tax=Dysosmobacter sp. TaxID=2591382 RepID=UPI002A97EA8C|nr:hypothetical protein [Dysosmobacter sp.]MDY5612608.1 hypothetical protein [Dysosmobacter sp.]
MSRNRTDRIIRNLLICVLIGAVFYACLGFPPYTVKGMCRQMERDYLLEEPLEPLYSLRDNSRYTNDHARYTFVVARSGDTYLSFQYEQNFLQNWRYYQHVFPQMSNSVLCAGRNGVLYVAGPFGNVASATAQVTVEKTTRIFDPDTGEQWTTRGPDTQTFTFQGEKAGEELFLFRYRSDEPHLWPELVPRAERELEDVVDLWYRSYRKGEEGGASHGWLHDDVPVRVTLYDEAGTALETLNLSVDTYELHNW